MPPSLVEIYRPTEETTVNFYETTRSHIVDDSTLHSHLHLLLFSANLLIHQTSLVQIWSQHQLPLLRIEVDLLIPFRQTLA
jgi:hypothetical protein